MKRFIVLLILAIPICAYGWMSVISLGGGVLDTGLSKIASYSFESGSFTTDDSGAGNTLTNNGTVAANTTNYQDGSQSAEFTQSTAKSLSRADGDLSSTFPGKSGTSNLEFTVCAWFRVDITGAEQMIASKYDADNGERSWRLFFENTSNNVAFNTGYNSGGSANTQITHGTTITAATDYTACASLAADGKTYTLRLYNASDIHEGTDMTGEITNAMSVDTAAFMIGLQDPNDNPFDGKIDLVQIWDKALTTTQMDTAVADHD